LSIINETNKNFIIFTVIVIIIALVINFTYFIIKHQNHQSE
jgi:hypothetical protein